MPLYFGITSRDLPLTLESVGNRWDQEPVRRPNGYPFYHWLQTERGGGRVEVDGRTYALGEGEGLLLAPFVPHAYARTGEVWLTAFATFAGRLEADIGKIVGKESVLPIGPETCAAFASWVEEVLALHERQRLDGPALSVDCYRMLLRMAHGAGRGDAGKHPLYRQYVAPVIGEIETNYARALTVEGLARSVYVSPQYLTRLFRRFLGCSVYAYLTGFRLGRAKELLANEPQAEVQQVAHRVGYHDASHFIAVFKAAAGCTPLEFRRLY